MHPPSPVGPLPSLRPAEVAAAVITPTPAPKHRRHHPLAHDVVPAPDKTMALRLFHLRKGKSEFDEPNMSFSELDDERRTLVIYRM